MVKPSSSSIMNRKKTSSLENEKPHKMVTKKKKAQKSSSRKLDIIPEDKEDNEKQELIPEVEAEISHPSVKQRYATVNNLQDLSYIRLDNIEIKTTLFEKVNEYTCLLLSEGYTQEASDFEDEHMFQINREFERREADVRLQEEKLHKEQDYF